VGYPNDARQAGNYTGGVGNHNTYAFNAGVCVLPLAEDPPTDPEELAAWSPVVVLRLHAPFRTREFTQSATKQQNPPPIAAPGDTGSFVFLGGTVEAVANLNTSYRNYDWSMGCRYTYVETCVSRNQDGLVLGTLPYEQVTDRENVAQYGYTVPTVGAVAHAGKAAVSGYVMGTTLVGGSSGVLNPTWGYNAAAFYPGTLFYDDLPNGGQPVVPTGG
jgi:hypothetical protein